MSFQWGGLGLWGQYALEQNLYRRRTPALVYAVYILFADYSLLTAPTQLHFFVAFFVVYVFILARTDAAV